MPTYSFLCETMSCRHSLEVYMSMAEYKPLIKCPICKKNSLNRDYGADCPTGSIILTDGNLTIGHLAKRNNERFSEDKKEAIWVANHSHMASPPPYRKEGASNGRKRRAINRKPGTKG